MTDRDRLIELIKQATTSHLDYLESIDQKGLTDTEGRAKFIADHLLANGVTLGKPLVEYLHPIDAYEGLKGKYLVFKADTGEQIVNCFVFRPDKDNTAVEALRFYAYTTDNKTLAEDIYTWVGKSKILPPCKVGDKVYEIQPIRQRVQSYEITTLKWNGHYWWFTWIIKDHNGIYGNVEGFNSHQIGKTVFLTREEAERALKELKDNAT